tara:strand:- start:548 stop:727 length:180 start_codon:yes stop_codon:yes gene_type:complete
MTDKETMERVQQEVHTANKSKMHESKKQTPSPTIDELKVSHHNFIVDHKVKVLLEQLKK